MTSSLYDELAVHDADTVAHVDYDAHIVGWCVTTLTFPSHSLVSVKRFFASLITMVEITQNYCEYNVLLLTVINRNVTFTEVMVELAIN